jgi:arylsulfatase A-like enzyme
LRPLVAVTFAAGVGGYWLNVWPAMPSLTTAAGKLLSLGFLAIFIPIVLLGAAWSARRRRSAAATTARVQALHGATTLLITAAVLWTWPTQAPFESSVSRDEIDSGKRSRPPVIVILVDTLRRDHLATYGYPKATSPNIDRLAADGIQFEQSTTSGNFTIPSIASLFTGLYPSGHGVWGAGYRIPEQAFTLAERFAAMGYRTGAFVGNATIRAEMGFARGFESYHPAPPPTWVRHRRTAIELIAARLAGGGDVSESRHLVPRALRWLVEDDGRPPFLYVHLMDPHSGYVPPREHFEAFLPEGVHDGPAHPPRIVDHFEREVWKGWEDLESPPVLSEDDHAGMVARYDGEIHYVDTWIAKVIEELKGAELYDDAIVVFLSDHGEEFGEHQGWFHGRTLYGEMIDMPLLIKLPKSAGAGLRTKLGVHMVDLAPTLAGLAGMNVEGPLQGRDRSSELLEAVQVGADNSTNAHEVFAYNERPPYLYSLRVGDWKVIERVVEDQPAWSLFHLPSDPGEQRNRAQDAPDDFGRMRLALEEFREDVRIENLRSGETPELDPETKRILRSLDYVE